MIRPAIPSPLLLSAVLLASMAPLHGAFEISGTLPAALAEAGSVVIERQSLENRSSSEVARTRIVEGRFHLPVDQEAGLYNLRIADAVIPFVAADDQPLRVSATGADRSPAVQGGPDQALFLAYEAFRTESLARLVLPVRAAIAQAAGQPAEVERLTAAEVAAYNQHRRELNDFTLEHLRESPALYAASLRWDGDYRLDELADVVHAFGRSHPQLEITRLMQGRIDRFHATAIGALAPELAGPTPSGGKIALSELRGRTVLVDFWASWCPPCRFENRNYAALYQRYRAQGFEILAVSVDQNEQAWKSAIAQDNATWLHMSDLSGWRTPLAGQYNVAALPASFLIGPDGRIIAKDLRGDALAALLAERFPGSPASASGRR